MFTDVEKNKIKERYGEVLKRITEHHISWIKLYYVQEGTTLPYEVARLEFNVHGEAVAGANEGPVFAEAAGTVTATFKKSGKLIATSYCNIHGLWESEKTITVE